jgi:PAS domain S-box-containing protein
VFNSSSDTLLLFAVEGKDAYRLVMANQALRDVLSRYRPEHGTREIAGLTLRQFITEVLGLPPERVERNNELFRRTIQSTEPLTYENNDWNRPDVFSEVTLVPVVDQAGRCTHVLRSSRDISARKVAQESLRLHDFVVTHAPLGVLMFDAEQRVTFANDAACGLLAQSRTQLLTGDIGDVVASGRRKTWSELLANARQRREQSAEVERVTNDGSRHPLELSIAFLDYGGQEISCVFIRDIAERRRAETTRRTLETELFHAQKMEAIGTLAGGIAHDFNNILAAIVGNAEVAQLELEPGHPARQDIAEVLVASRRARDLVRQILTFSRKHESVRRSVLLAEVVEDVLRLLRATIPSTIELRKAIAAPDAHVFGDPTQLHQVLMNLCTNAAHAVGDHHGIIEVGQSIVDVDADSTRTDLMPGRYVCIWVADSGHGMDRTTLERAFEPFFTTKAPGVGTGLGLAVVHGIVRNHEGVALVESTPDRGTTFQLYFPLFTPTERLNEPESTTIPRGRGQCVAFVDDEPALTRVARRTLERLGYTVFAFRSATDALDAVRANPSAFDVVISDLTMPGLTGAQLAVELHRVRANLPMILSTGYLDRLDANATESLHVRELLIKPYTTEALATAVRRALESAA